MLMTLRSNGVFPDQNNSQAFNNYSTQSGQIAETVVPYTDEDQRQASPRNRPNRQSSLTPHTASLGSPRSRSGTGQRTPQQMNGLPQPVMYVRALYDYEADDRTSLSFHEGDVIQVITQLESGWWDGVINGVRGWFPSNYCQVISNPDDPLDTNGRDMDDDADEEDDDQSDYEDRYEDDADSELGDSTHLPLDGLSSRERTRADFWIPQATPDGRLFYFNTETGESSSELPLESPSSPTETGPRNRMNVNIPEKTRPPAEMMARGYVQDEADDSDANSASELDGESIMLAQNQYAVSVIILLDIH
jgi:son of sevenless-like protein